MVRFFGSLQASTLLEVLVVSRDPHCFCSQTLRWKKRRKTPAFVLPLHPLPPSLSLDYVSSSTSQTWHNLPSDSRPLQKMRGYL